MLKNITLGLIICAVALTTGKILLAGSGGKDAGTGASLVIKNQEVGNKICPVMGNQIVEEAKVTYVYEGKVYNFCCEGCIEEFKKNPAKYIKMIEEEKNNPQSIANK